MLKVDDIEAEAASGISVEQEILIVEIAVAKDQFCLEADSRIVLRACPPVAPFCNLRIISHHMQARVAARYPPG